MKTIRHSILLIAMMLSISMSAQVSGGMAIRPSKKHITTKTKPAKKTPASHKSVKDNSASAQKYYALACDYYFGTNGKEKNDAEAAKWFGKAADLGNVSAQYRLGECYENGRGVVKDDLLALQWYTQAAEKGDANAQFMLGIYNNIGKGIPINKEESYNWFVKAAEQGHVGAQYNIGRYYEEGICVSRNYAEAIKWYRKAAEKDYTLALYHLGDCYEQGKGVSQSYAEAIDLYTKATKQGNTAAMCALGRCYEEGKGVRQDEIHALKLYTYAADQGDQRAIDLLGYRYYKKRNLIRVSYISNYCEPANFVLGAVSTFCPIEIKVDWTDKSKKYHEGVILGLKNSLSRSEDSFCFFRKDYCHFDYKGKRKGTDSRTTVSVRGNGQKDGSYATAGNAYVYRMWIDKDTGVGHLRHMGTNEQDKDSKYRENKKDPFWYGKHDLVLFSANDAAAIYYVKVFDEEKKNIIHYWIPCVDFRNNPCFYDEKTGLTVYPQNPTKFLSFGEKIL